MVRLWSEEEETILVDTVLRRVREGGTQTAAFQEAAEQLGRTPEACKCRWNSQLRRQYEDSLQLAKASRSAIRKQRNTTVPELDFRDIIASVNLIIRFLRFWRDRWVLQRRLTEELRERIRKQDELICNLRHEIQLLRKRTPGTTFKMESNGNLIRIEGGKR